jgi:hypothetical protein
MINMPIINPATQYVVFSLSYKVIMPGASGMP